MPRGAFLPGRPLPSPIALPDAVEREPWVAVVVLAYKQQMYLDACLQSLDAHGLEGVQVLLVDNSSGDGTAERMQAWAEGHSHVMLLLNSENLGHCRAFNRALQQVRAPYVLDLAADDRLLPGGLQALVKVMEAHPEAVLAHGNALHIDEEGHPLGYEHSLGEARPDWSGRVWRQLFGQRFICPPTVLFRTEALREVGGYDESLSFEDFDIWMRLLRRGEAVYVPQQVCAYRQHGASLSVRQLGERDEAMLDSVCRICRKAFALAEDVEERKAVAGFARYHLRLSAYLGRGGWVGRFGRLLKEEGHPVGGIAFWKLLALLPLAGLYRWYAARGRRMNRVAL